MLGDLPDLLQIPRVAMTNTRRVYGGPAATRIEDLQLPARLATEGAFRPVINRTYPFSQMVWAHHYVDTGRKKGNVAITLDAAHAGAGSWWTEPAIESEPVDGFGISNAVASFNAAGQSVATWVPGDVAGSSARKSLWVNVLR